MSIYEAYPHDPSGYRRTFNVGGTASEIEAINAVSETVWNDMKRKGWDVNCVRTRQLSNGQWVVSMEFAKPEMFMGAGI